MSKAYDSQIPLEPPPEGELPPNLPAPARRHGSPAGPWPWLDTNYQKGGTLPPVISYNGLEFCPHEPSEQCDKRCWIRYPEAIFTNWEPSQVKRSRIKDLTYLFPRCTIFHVDVGCDGQFSDTGQTPVSSYSKEDQVHLMELEVSVSTERLF